MIVRGADHQGLGVSAPARRWPEAAGVKGVSGHELPIEVELHAIRAEAEGHVMPGVGTDRLRRRVRGDVDLAGTGLEPYLDLATRGQFRGDMSAVAVTHGVLAEKRSLLARVIGLEPKLEGPFVDEKVV